MKTAALCLMTITPLLSACMTTRDKSDIPERGVSAGYICEADGLQSMVGQRATAELGATAVAESGSKSLRWIPPNSAVTMDFRQDRLNISYDENMVITRIRCG